MIAVSTARRIIRNAIPPPQSESVVLNKASGRILAREIIAPFPMPRFTNSAMDGFAVRAVDTLGAGLGKPVKLTLSGTVSAGVSADFKINRGECAQCMTGAPLPRGADAIVMVEHTSGFTNNSTVSIYKSVSPGQHVRVKGEEIPKGEFFLSAGTRIGAAEIGILATFGYGEVLVNKRPKIALFATGDELVAPGETLNEGQIYNSNLPVLTDLGHKAGAEIVMTDVLRDERKALKQFLAEAFDRCDVIISSGGVSMGKYDYIHTALTDLGVTEHFRRVAQKPGKPLFFGSIKQTLIFGLPGNPVSAFIGFMEYIWPVIEQWMGKPPGKKLTARLIAPFPRDPEKYRFLFGRTWIEKDKLVCAPTIKLGSHMLTSTLEANCIIGAEPGDGVLKPDATVNVRLLPWKSIGQK